MRTLNDVSVPNRSMTCGPQGFGSMHGYLGSDAKLGVSPAGLAFFGQFLATLRA